MAIAAPRRRIMSRSNAKGHLLKFLDAAARLKRRLCSAAYIARRRPAVTRASCAHQRWPCRSCPFRTTAAIDRKRGRPREREGLRHQRGSSPRALHRTRTDDPFLTIETPAVSRVRLSRFRFREVAAHRRVSMTRHGWSVLAATGADKRVGTRVGPTRTITVRSAAR